MSTYLIYIENKTYYMAATNTIIWTKMVSNILLTVK
jgi:hypothetical protein